MLGLSTPDLVLLSIALSMLVAAVGGLTSSLSLWTALGAGSLPAGGSIGYALFCDPPDDTA
ncbi:hypothetical protein ACFQGE_10155 [Halomicroarcula sp. GCM10025817]|jgi:hypothetical protein|uniref:hypothetical protein n=1 Tax=Haloarcula TaxID=2237 RepID=UPI0023E8F857|nr:hypothetical protein [Halomicroarcula sp. SYNS111]